MVAKLPSDSIGYHYVRLGQKEKGVEYANRSVAILRSIGNTIDLPGFLLALSHMMVDLGRHQEARKQAAEVLELNRGRFPILARGALQVEARSYTLGGENLKALESYNRLLPLLRTSGIKGAEADSLGDMMKLCALLGRPRLAIFYGKQAVNIVQEARGKLAGIGEEERKNFLARFVGSYRRLADLLIAAGRIPEAQQVLGMLKEEEYFDFVRRDSNEAGSLDRRATLTPAEAEWERRYKEVADQVAELGARRGALSEKKNRTPEEERRLTKLDADLTAAGTAFQQFLDRLSAEFGETKQAMRVEQVRDAQGLQEDLRRLGRGVVALHTIVGEQKYRIILTTPDTQVAREYPVGSADLNGKVASLRQALQNPKSDPLPLAQELYKIIVGPVEKDLERAGAETLMWSLDGALRYLPVAALHDGKGYLIERYRNTV